MSHSGSDSPQVELARVHLSRFVRSEAKQLADELGFGWRAAELAPVGLNELAAEFRSCHQTGLPFRVYKGFSEDTIYDSECTNWAFRAWHDSRHVWLGADFSTEAELEVASCHLARAKAAGLGPDTIEFQLLYADTVYQTLFIQRTHRFVVHQRQFALDCICLGLDAAIEHELRQASPEGTAA